MPTDLQNELKADIAENDKSRLKTGLKRDIIREQETSSWLAVQAQAATDPTLLDSIMQSRDKEESLYNRPEYDIDQMTPQSLLAEAMDYQTWDVIRDQYPTLEQKKQLIKSEREKRKTNAKDYVKFDSKLYNAEGYRVPDPAIRVANSLYLSMTLDTDLESATAFYDDLVWSLFNGKEPDDIRPVSRMVRKWYVDKHLKEQGLDGTLMRMARKHQDGEDVNWDVVLNNIPEDQRDEFWTYVTALSSPKQRGFFAKTGALLARQTKRAKTNFEVNTALLDPTQSDTFRQNREQLISEFQSENKRPPFGIEMVEINHNAETKTQEVALAKKKIEEASTANDPLEGETIPGKLWYGTMSLLPDVAFSAAAGVATMSPFGTAYYWYTLTSSDLYEQMKDLGFDNETSANTTRITSIPIALINAIQMKQLANLSPAIRKKAVLAADQSYAKWAGQKALATGITFGKEWGEEGLEAVTKVVGIAIANVLSKEKPGINWMQDVIQPEIEGLKQAGWALPGLVVGGKAMEISAEVKYINQLVKTGMDKKLARSVAAIHGEGMDALIQNPLFKDLPAEITKKLEGFRNLPESQQEAILESVVEEMERLRITNRQKALDIAVEILTKNGIKNVIVGEVDTIPGAEPGTERTGETSLTPAGNAVIKMALGSDTITGGHEVMHVLETLLSADEMLLIDSEYADRELAAEAFGEYYDAHRDGGPETTRIQQLWNKVVQTLKRIRNAFMGRGYRTADDVFADLTAGKYQFGEVRGEAMRQPEAAKSAEVTQAGVEALSNLRRQFQTRPEITPDIIQYAYDTASTYHRFRLQGRPDIDPMDLAHDALMDLARKKTFPEPDQLKSFIYWAIRHSYRDQYSEKTTRKKDAMRYAKRIPDDIEMSIDEWLSDRTIADDPDIESQVSISEEYRDALKSLYIYNQDWFELLTSGKNSYELAKEHGQSPQNIDQKLKRARNYVATHMAGGEWLGPGKGEQPDLLASYQEKASQVTEAEVGMTQIPRLPKFQTKKVDIAELYPAELQKAKDASVKFTTIEQQEDPDHKNAYFAYKTWSDEIYNILKQEADKAGWVLSFEEASTGSQYLSLYKEDDNGDFVDDMKIRLSDHRQVHGGTDAAIEINGNWEPELAAFIEDFRNKAIPTENKPQYQEKPSQVTEAEVLRKIADMATEFEGNSLSVLSGIPIAARDQDALYDYGDKGLKFGEAIHNPRTDKSSRTFEPEWLRDMGRIEIGTRVLLREVKARTPEVWPVKVKQGRFWKTEYYIAPKKIIDKVKAILPEESLVPKRITRTPEIRETGKTMVNGIVFDETGVPDFLADETDLWEEVQPEAREPGKRNAPTKIDQPMMDFDEAVDEIITSVEKRIKRSAELDREQVVVQYENILTKLKTEHEKLVERKDTAAAKALKKQTDRLQDRIERLKRKYRMVKSKLPSIKKESIKSRIRRTTGQVTIGDVIDESKALKASMKKAEQAARKAFSEGKKEGIEKTKTYYQDMLKRQAENRKNRKRINAALKTIARVKKAIKSKSSSIDFKYKEAIENLLSGLTAKTRSKKTMDQRERMRQFLDQNPDQLKNIPTKLMAELNNKVANDYTIEELEQIASEAKRLADQGRLLRKLKEQRRKADEQKAKDQIVQTVLAGKELETVQGPKVGPDAPTVAETVEKLYQGERAHTLRPARIFDMLDGGRGTFSGFIHRMFYDDVNEAEDAKIRMVDSRLAGVESKMEELGITVVDLVKPREVPGVEAAQGQWTLERMMGVYMANQNERARLAVLYGNQITESDIQAIIDTMPTNAKILADWMIDDYQNRFPALREAVILNTNNDLNHESRYSPIRRTEGNFETPEKQLIEEIKHREGLKKGRVEKGFTINRIDIPPEYQTPIDLEAVKIFKQQVDIQEHYIAFASLINRLHRILSGPEVRAAIEQKAGKSTHKAVEDYLSRVANPNIYKTFKELDNLSRRLRRNFATAALCFNVVTFMKQLPSVALYMGDAGPEYLLQSGLEFAADPKKIIEFVRSKDPQVKNVAIERELQEMMYYAQEHASRLNELRRVGMKPIRFFDTIARTIGWYAVYQRAMNNGAGEAEAIRMARNATLRTQPAASPKDLPSLYTQGEAWNWLLMFSNQLNNIYNMITYDVPAKVKSKDMTGAAASATGLAISALGIWMLQNKTIPDDPEDILDVGLSQFLGSIPIMGSGVVAYRSGYFGRENPVIGSPAKALAYITKGKIEKAIRPTLESVSYYSGLPYVAGNRIYRTIEEEDPMYLIGGKPKR